jgi:DNA repair protein RecO (recombination protein O)
VPLVSTPAVILHVMPYGDTSKILRLLTRDLGLQSAIARGARRPRSPTGPRLDLFAFGTATLRMKEHRDLSPLALFEPGEARPALAQDVGRFSAASAVAELALKCVPADVHPAVFDAVAGAFQALADARAEDVEAVALAACWAVVVSLGFTPSLDRCAVCGAPIEGATHFSASLGGAVCVAHRGGAGSVAKLTARDRDALLSLVAGLLPEPPLDARHAAAHRRLLLAFIRHHLAEDRPLPAMAFWDKEAWNATSS